MYTMYANASNYTPFYTHVSSYVVWRVHPPVLNYTIGKISFEICVTHWSVGNSVDPPRFLVSFYQVGLWALQQHHESLKNSSSLVNTCLSLLLPTNGTSARSWPSHTYIRLQWLPTEAGIRTDCWAPKDLTVARWWAPKAVTIAERSLKQKMKKP